MENLSIGSTPPDEDCAQVGSKQYDYESRSREECKQYIHALHKKLGVEPPGARLFVKANSHDFGVYYEVNCRYDENDEDATNYANACESDGPMTWAEVGMTAPFTYESAD